MKYAYLLSLLLFINSPSFAAALDGRPLFILGAGGGVAMTSQNVDGADSAAHLGLNMEGAYSPLNNFFVGFEINTFSPMANVRASDYLFSAQYHLRKITFGALLGMQAVVDGRANGIATDVHTGNILQNENNSIAYGLKASFDQILPLGFPEFNWGVSPVLYYIRSLDQQSFAEIIISVEFRLWGY